MSGLSRVCQLLRPWIVVESTGLINRPVFGHVKVNIRHSQQCKGIRLRRFTTGDNVDPQLGREQTSGTTVKGTSVSLADISKPVPFNTHQLVCRLQHRGYTLEQAEELVEILNTVIQQSVASEIGSCVKKVSMDKLELSLRGNIDNVRRDQILLEKTELTGMKSQLKRMDDEILQLMETLKEEVKKVHSGISLDINIERSRVKEEHGELQQKIKDTHNKITTEVADLKTAIESHKLEMVKYLAGGIATVVTLILSVVMGLWRLMK